MEKLVETVLLFIAALGFYLFLAGSIDPVEISASLLFAGAATLITTRMNAVAERHYAFTPPLHAILRPFAALVPETFTVGRALVAVALTGTQRQQGGFVEQPFDSGPEDDAATRGRRAISVLGISLAPRTFVVRGEESGPLLLHGLPPKPASSDEKWPA